jgi:hypothetical protein
MTPANPHPLPAAVARVTDCLRERQALDAGPRLMVSAWADDIEAILDALAGAAEEIERLTALLNTPETADFVRGVMIEAPHQIHRWGASHDAGKDPLDWVWLLGHLVNKAARAALDGDTSKAQHHTISSAAALANWHAQLAGRADGVRPGIDAVARGIEAA